MVDTAEKNIGKQKKILFFGLVGFVVLLLFGMWISDPNKGKPSAREVAIKEAQEVKTNFRARSLEAVTPKESWIAKSEAELSLYKQRNRSLQDTQGSLLKRLKDLEDKFNNSNKKQASDLRGSPFKGASSLPPPPNYSKLPVVTPGSMADMKSPQVTTQMKDEFVNTVMPPSPNKKVSGESGSISSAIQVFTFDDESSKSKKGKKKKNISHYLPPGAFGKVVLLSGADAPTGGQAANNPVPVLMRLIDHGTLPNFFESEIKDCHVTGEVIGDLSSERAKIRTEKLSCILVNGDVVAKNIKGWVNGEDGKEGFRGRVVEKAGALLARTFVAGTFSGLGTSVATSFQNVSTNPLGAVSTLSPNDAGKAGVATGLSTSLDALANYYMERANEMYPIIELSANRIGELVLQEGVDLGSNIIGNMGNEYE